MKPLVAFVFAGSTLAATYSNAYAQGAQPAKSAEPATAENTGPLFLIVEKGKIGFIDAKGTVVIEPTFEGGLAFSDGLAVVRMGKRKWGAIDRSGTLVVPAEFDYLRGFDGGFAPAEKMGKWGVIDKTGTLVVPASYDRVGSVSEGAATFKQDGKWGLVSVEGKELIPARYDHLSAPKQGWCIAKNEGRYFFVDTSGVVQLDPVDRGNIAWEFSEGLTQIRIATGKKGKRKRWGYIDRSGKLVIKPKFNRAHRFSEGLAEVEVTPRDGFKWGYIDKRGRVVIKPKWHHTEPFSEGRAAVKVGEKYGFIDRKGKLVIDATFDWATSFEHGLARVELHQCADEDRDSRGVCMERRTDLVGYIDTNGAWVRKPTPKR